MSVWCSGNSAVACLVIVQQESLSNSVVGPLQLEFDPRQVLNSQLVAVTLHREGLPW